MFTISVHKHYGTNPWLARITGRDQKFGMNRSFVRAAERDMSRSGSTGTFRWMLDDVGLYQIGGTKRDNEYFVITKTDSGELETRTITTEQAMILAKLLDSGVNFSEAVSKAA